MKADLQKLLSQVSILAPVQIERFQTPSEQKSKFKISPLGLLIALFAAWCSWACNQDKEMPERVLRAALAAFFGIVYLAWYYIAGGAKACRL